jgi:hypothetical protein
MNRRAKHKIIAALWLALFFLLGSGVWSFQAGELMILAYLIVSVIVYVLYAFLARCPACRMPLLLRPLKIFGIELYVWSLLTPERCRHCDTIVE